MAVGPLVPQCAQDPDQFPFLGCGRPGLTLGETATLKKWGLPFYTSTLFLTTIDQKSINGVRYFAMCNPSQIPCLVKQDIGEGQNSTQRNALLLVRNQGRTEWRD